MMRRSTVWAGLLLAAACASAGTTKYWGGGTVLIANGTLLNPATGNWTPGTLVNWGNVSSGAANYSAWDNAAGDIAAFGANGGTYTVTAQSSVTNNGIAVYQFSSSGGTINLRTASATTYNFTIAAGSPMVVPNGVVLDVQMNNNAQTQITSGFTVSGGGRLNFSSTLGTFSSSGTIDIQGGTFRLGGTHRDQIAGATVNVGSGTYFECNQSSASSGTAGAQVTAVGGPADGTIRTGGAAGTCMLNWDSTTGGTVASWLTDGGTAGSLLGFTKNQASTVTFMNGNNNYSGGTLLYGGTLVAGAAGAVPGWVVCAGGQFQSLVAGGLETTAGSAVAYQLGSILLGNIALGRFAAFNEGVLLCLAAGDIPGTGRVLDGMQPGSIIAAQYAIDNAFLRHIAEGFDGIVALSADSSNDLNFNDSGVGGAFPAARLGAVYNDATYNGTLTPCGDTYRLGGGNKTLTLTGALANGTGARNLDVGNIRCYGLYGGTAPMAGGTNRVQLTAACTLTGNVTVGPYSMLTLSGANGALGSATALQVNGGRLELIDASGASNNDRVPNTRPLSVNRGGMVYFRGTGGQTEDIGELQLNSGLLRFDAARATGSGNANLRFASLSRQTGATAIFQYSNGTISFLTPPPVNAGAGNTLGGWAMVSGSSWATWNGSAVGFAGVNAGAPNTWLPTYNISLAAASATLVDAGATAINSLKNSGGTGAALDLNGTTFTIVDGGVLNTANNVFTIQNGNLTAGPDPGGMYQLCFWNEGSGRSLAVSASIVDNGGHPVAVVKAGRAFYGGGNNALTLSGNNFYSGGTYIDSPVLFVSTDTSLGTGPLVVGGFMANVAIDNNGGYALCGLTLNGSGTSRTIANPFQVNADLFVSIGTITSATLTGPITLANDAALWISGATTWSGTISGTGGLRIRANTTLSGSIGNSYSGPTVVTYGTLTLGKSSGNAVPNDLYIGSLDQNGGSFAQRLVTLSAPDQIADTAAVVFVAGGVNQIAPILQLNGNSDAIGGLKGVLGHGIVENNHASAAVTLALSGSGSYSFGGAIRNRATAGGGTMAILKSGSGTQKLEGASTYTGGTTVSGGKLFANNASGSGTGTGLVSIGVSGTLGGSGYIAGAVTVNGTIDAGSDVATVGMLTVSDDVSFAASSSLTVDLAGNTSGDKLVVSGSGKTLALGTGPVTLAVNLLDGYSPVKAQWTIMEAVNGAVLSGTLPVPPARYSVEKVNNTVVLKHNPAGTLISIQ